MGSMSEAFGAQYVQQDYLMRQWRNAELAQSYWQTAPEHVKQLVGSFVSGVKAYQAKHPDRIPEHAVDLEPWMIFTIGRAMTLRWPVGTIMDDLKEGQRRQQESEGFVWGRQCLPPACRPGSSPRQTGRSRQSPAWGQNQCPC